MLSYYLTGCITEFEGSIVIIPDGECVAAWVQGFLFFLGQSFKNYILTCCFSHVIVSEGISSLSIHPSKQEFRYSILRMNLARTCWSGCVFWLASKRLEIPLQELDEAAWEGEVSGYFLHDPTLKERVT